MLLTAVRSTVARQTMFRSVAGRAMSSSAAPKASRRGTAVALGLAAGGAVAGFSMAMLPVHADDAVDWKKMRTTIEDIMESEESINPSVDNAPGAKGGGGDIGPMLVRLAWHCSGSYQAKDGTGGSEGATMRFNPESDHGNNAGLNHARDLLEPVKKQFPAATYADIYIYAANVAIEAMGGPALTFRPGRSDAAKPASPSDDVRFTAKDRLPDGYRTDVPMEQHLRDIFYRMGFNDQEIVCLSGAHAMGRCHTDRSGFWGPWTRAPSTFSNEYYRLLLDEKWSAKQTHKGAKWTGPPQFENPEGDLMMLYTDVALVWDPRFKTFVEQYKSDEDKFFDDFAQAWTKLTELGCKNLQAPIQMEGVKSKKKGWFW